MLLRSGLPVGCRFNSPRKHLETCLYCDGRSVQMAEKGLLFLVRAVKFSSPPLFEFQTMGGQDYCSGRARDSKRRPCFESTCYTCATFFYLQARRPFSPYGKIPFFDSFNYERRRPPDQTKQFVHSRNWKPSSLVQAVASKNENSSLFASELFQRNFSQLVWYSWFTYSRDFSRFNLDRVIEDSLFGMQSNSRLRGRKSTPLI